MAVTIASLAAKLSLDTKSFVAGFASASKTAKSFGASINTGLTNMVSNVGPAIAASVSLSSAIAAVSQSMQNIDRNAKLADRLGITYESMQKLSLAASLAGADVEVLAKGMLMMGKNIGSGGKALDVRFFEVADSIAAIEDPAERAKKAMEIFGRSGLEILNVLQAGGKGLRDSAESIDRLGLSISRVEAAKVEAANDAFEVMSTSITGVIDKISVQLSPTIERFSDRAVSDLERTGKAIDMLGGKWDQLGTIIQAVTDASTGLPGSRGSTGVAKVLAEQGKIMRELSPAIEGKATDMLNPDEKPFGNKLAPKNPFAADRGSIEAARIIQGSSQANAMPRLLEAMLAELKVINRNSDPVAAETRGTNSLQVAVI